MLFLRPALVSLVCAALVGTVLVACKPGGTMPHADYGPKAWAKKTDAQRGAYMKDVVLPKMKAVFQAHEAAAHKNFDCVTCHGAGAKKGNFHMPNPALPKLDPTGRFKAHKPAEVKFMMTQVVPTMAKLLGLPRYDPKTRQGFGCGRCHTFKR